MISNLNTQLWDQNEAKALINLCNTQLRKALRNEWVCFYDAAKNRIILGPEYDPERPIDAKKISQIQSRVIGYTSPKFFKSSKNFLGILPVGVKKDYGYFVLGPRKAPLGDEEKKVLIVLCGHLKTAFAHADLNRNLQRRVQAQVKNITYKNKRLGEVINNRLEFVQTASHELRTPITALSGALQILLNKKVNENERQELLKLAYQRAQNLSSLVSGILRLANYRKHDSELDIKEDIDLQEMFKGIFEVIKAEAKLKGLDLIFSSQKKISVKGNHIYLEQAFYNLIENAVQNTEKGAIEVSVRANEKNVVIGIRDTGPGIEDDFKDRIFKKSVKGKNSKGLGLGLYLARTIIDTHHKGHIWFENTNPGTVFYVRLKRSMV